MNVDIVHLNKGLDNTGNSCYFNVIIQTLKHLQPFRDKFNNVEILNLLSKKLLDTDTNLVEGLDDSIIVQMKKLFHIMEYESVRNLKPVLLRAAVEEKNVLFLNNDQQDAHEAFIAILELLHDEISQNVNLIPIQPGNAYDTCNNFYRNSYSPVYELFHGIYSAEKHCSICNHVSKSFEPNCCMSLDIPKFEGNQDIEINIQDYIFIRTKIPSLKLTESELEQMSMCISDENREIIRNHEINKLESKKSYTLTECLNEYYKQNTIESYRCPECNVVNTCHCTYNVAVHPKVLFIQLKRFKYGHPKNSNSITIDHEIELPTVNGPVRYKLISIINHVGNNPNYGHYYMMYYNENEPDKWTKINDSVVSRILETSIKNTEIYLLFYVLAQDADY